MRLRIDANRSVIAFDKPRILLRALRLPKLDLPPDPSRLTLIHWKLRSSSARMSRRERFACCDGPRPIMLRSPRGTARIRGLVSRAPPRRTAVIECGDSSSSSPRGPNGCPERACRRRKYHRTRPTPVANPSTPKIVPRIIAVLFVSEPPIGFPFPGSPGPPGPPLVPVLDGWPVFELVLTLWPLRAGLD